MIRSQPLLNCSFSETENRQEEKGWRCRSHPFCVQPFFLELTTARAVVAAVATDDRPCGEGVSRQRAVRQRLRENRAAIVGAVANLALRRATRFDHVRMLSVT